MQKKQPVRDSAISDFVPAVGARPADEIQGQIRAMLSSQRLKAGDRLPSERALAEQFSVSRNSVRQALRSLVDSGLLTMKKGAAGGAFIRDGGGDAVLTGISDLYSLGAIRPEHLTEVRILLGVEVVKFACQRCTPDEIDALEENVKLAEEAAKDQDFSRRTALNLEFHRMLARMTRNPLLVTLSDAVIALNQQFVLDMEPIPNRVTMPLRRHLLADLRARESEAAAERMRNYLLRVQKIYLSHTKIKARKAD